MSSIVDLGRVSAAIKDTNWDHFQAVVDEKPNAPQASIDVVALDCHEEGDAAWNSLLSLMEGWGYPPPVRPVNSLLQSEDIVHEYTFKFPNKAVFGAGRKFLDRGDLAYDPATNKLYLWSKGAIREISIPDNPGDKASEEYLDNPGACPVSDQVGTAFDTTALGSLCDPAKSFGGFEVIEDRFWLNFWEFYNTAGRDNLGVACVDTDFSNPRGAWRVGPAGSNIPHSKAFHANKCHQIVMRGDPAWVLKYTGKQDGEVGFSFRQRGAGAFGGAKGPGLFSWDADPTKPHGDHLNGSMLLSYQGNEWAAGYRNAEYDWHVAGTWVYGPGFSTVLYFYGKGHMSKAEADNLASGSLQGHSNGPNWYGQPPYGCNGDKGWHANPYTPEVYMYDADILGEVQMGNIDPRSGIQHYGQMNTDFLWKHPGAAGGCRELWMSGATYDPVNRRLFVLQLKAYKTGGSNPLPVVHVLKIK